MTTPAPFEIVERDGVRVASNGQQTLQLVESSQGRVFRRRGVKEVGTPAARPVEWVVGELDGVRCYFDGQHVVMTRGDLWP